MVSKYEVINGVTPLVLVGGGFGRIVVEAKEVAKHALPDLHVALRMDDKKQTIPDLDLSRHLGIIGLKLEVGGSGNSSWIPLVQDLGEVPRLSTCAGRPPAARKIHRPQYASRFLLTAYLHDGV